MARKTAEVPQTPSMAESEDDPIGKYPTRTAKRLKAAVPPSVKKVETQTFWGGRGGSFRGCLLVAVAVLGLVLLWPVCLVWVSSSLLLAFFFPFPVSNEMGGDPGTDQLFFRVWGSCSLAPSREPEPFQVSPCCLGLRILAPEAMGRRDILSSAS